MSIAIDDKWRVRASHTITLPMPAGWVWGQMRDVKRFITWDPLHRVVHLQSARAMHTTTASPQGTKMVIEHRLFGIGPDRLSRILWWKEGCGFAFSDLSKRGVTKGFPHICMYELDALNDEFCRLTVTARGRWTARFIPRWVSTLWLRWVLVMTGNMIRQRLTAYRTVANLNAER